MVLLKTHTKAVAAEEQDSWKLSLYKFLYPPLTSSFLDPSILFSTLFLISFHLRSFLRARYQVSRPNDKTGTV
jgi:hypothetical protein